MDNFYNIACSMGFRNGHVIHYGRFYTYSVAYSSGISDHKRNKRQKSSLEMVRFNMKSKDEISVICNAQPV